MRKLFFATFILMMLMISLLNGQAISQDRSIYRSMPQSTNDSPTGQKYFTGPDGIVRMYVNIWGHVNKPGTHMVYDGIDFVTLLSICGGPKQGANLGKIKLIRSEADENGNRVHEIDFNEFVNTGNKEAFLEIKPNDTLVIGEKTTHMLMSNMSIVNTVLHIYQIYFQAEYYRTR